MKVRIVLVKTNKSFLDKAVKFFTNTDYRHAAIMFPEITGEVLFEASGFKRQVLAYRKLSDLKNSKIEILSFDIDNPEGFDWALNKIGSKYDYKGFFLWSLNRQVRGKLYCFEYIANIMKFDSQLKSYVQTIKDGSISGLDIYKLAVNIKKADAQKYDV